MGKPYRISFFGWAALRPCSAIAATRRRDGTASSKMESRDMYIVYIIQSIEYPKRFYTGFTEQIDYRLKEHNTGKSTHTNKYRPWKLMYYSAFVNKKDALDFEKYLKTASGIAFRNKRLIST
jgi:predicted GIY-YIG superfamily endonuclease